MRNQKKTMFSEFICSRSNDAPESDHSLEVCTMCQRGKCFVDTWLKPDFTKLNIMRLLSMKDHIISSGIVWGFLEFFDDCQIPSKC